jgi:hypothetical protein
MTWVLIAYMANIGYPTLDHVYFATEGACELVAADLKKLPHKLIGCYPTGASK